MRKIIPFLVFCLVATCNAELRTWTAVNGKEIEAEFISNIDGYVSLKLKSGKVFKVPLNKLSKSDQEFLNLKIVKDDQKPPTIEELLAAIGTPLNKFEKIIADKKYLEKFVTNSADQNFNDVFEPAETINRTNRTYSILYSEDREKTLVHGIWMIKGNNLYWMELVADGIKIPKEEHEVLKAKIITLDKEKSFFSLPPIEEENLEEEQITWELIEEFTSVEMQKFNDEATNKNFDFFKIKSDIDIHDVAVEGIFLVVKEWIDQGVDINSEDIDGWTVLDCALCSKNEELIAFVKNSGGQSNANKSIFIASGVGDLEAVKKHVNAGIDVNFKDADGWTPLFYATDQINVAEFLIGEGAKLNVLDNNGWTPLDEAIDINDRAVIDLLLKNGGKTSKQLKAKAE